MCRIIFNFYKIFSKISYKKSNNLIWNYEISNFRSCFSRHDNSFRSMEWALFVKMTLMAHNPLFNPTIHFRMNRLTVLFSIAKIFRIRPIPLIRILILTLWLFTILFIKSKNERFEHLALSKIRFLMRNFKKFNLNLVTL